MAEAKARSGATRWGGLALLTLLAGGSAVGTAATGAIDAAWGIASGAAAGLLALVFLAAATSTRQAHDRKVSAELTLLSERLLRLEARPATPAAAPARASSAPLAGLATDVELLSRLVRDVAEALGTHERRLAALEARPSAPTIPATPKEPPAAPPRELSSPDDFARATSAILRRLSGEPGPEPTPPPPAHPRDAPPLDPFEAGRIEIHLHPVVTLPQRRTRFYEALARLRTSDGAILDAAEFLPALERRGQLPRLDATVVAQALAVARHLAGRGSDAKVSCNVAAASLSDAGFVSRVEEQLSADPAAAGIMLLEIRQRDLQALPASAIAALVRFRTLGATLVADRAIHPGTDWAALAKAGIAIVKMDAEVLLDPARAPGPAALTTMMARLGLQLVATGIEREATIPDLLDYDVPLAQGFAIAPVRPIRAEVLAADAIATAAPPPDAGATAADASGRVPFREFLRRAG